MRLLDPGRHLGERLLEALLQPLDALLDLVAQRLGELLELFGRHHPPLHGGGEDEAHGRAQERDALTPGLLLDLRHRPLLALLQLLLDDLAAGAEILALEGVAERRQQIAQELVEVPP
ncbi:hypothetical protein HRbin39_01134 [bacterium HR39]|nr:hypothetical protein HRbin39_01134 [bacterium HR39]